MFKRFMCWLLDHDWKERPIGGYECGRCGQTTTGWLRLDGYPTIQPQSPTDCRHEENSNALPRHEDGDERKPMGKVNSRQKGKRGEREFARFLRDNGFEARRGVQYQGGPESPDVVCETLAHIHFEVKFGYAGMDIGTKLLHEALAQAIQEMPDRSLPVVAWKPPRKGWRLTWNESVGVVTVEADKHALQTLKEVSERYNAPKSE